MKSHGVADDTDVMDTAAASTTIALWSFHEPGYSLLKGEADPNKSKYHDDVDIMAAYAELHRRVKTNQIIWCYTRKEDFRETGVPMIEWAFEVPKANVLRFCDAVVWARIIGKAGSTPPDKLRGQLRKQVLSRFSYDPTKSKAYEAQIISEFWNQPAPSGDWWNHLFVEYTGQEGVDALISHPAHPSWYVGEKCRGFKAGPDRFLIP